MAENFWGQHQPVKPPARQTGFLENHPFSELAESGWSVVAISAARARSGKPGLVRTVTMKDHFGRLFTFDVDDNNRMRDHATFTRNDSELPLMAMTPSAVTQLAASDHDVDYRILKGIRGVRNF